MKKIKSIFLLVVIGISIIVPMSTFGYPITTNEENIEQEQVNEQPIVDPPTIDADPPVVLSNDSWVYSGVITSGEKFYYVLENVPLNSANYQIQGFEGSPASMNIDVYVKFEATPTTIDYDYRAITSDQYETVDIEIPEDDEYGDMFIMIYCTSGSGSVYARAYYVTDSNGAWRSADIRSTPENGGSPVSFAGSVSNQDINDFYKIYLYSGQELKIDASVTSGGGSSYVDLFLYDEDHYFVASDFIGSDLDILYSITSFESQYYYLLFKYAESYVGSHSYSAVVTDERVDNNNRYEFADDVVALNLTGGSIPGSMNPNDINDYWYFRADSGQRIQITVTINDPVDYPYYRAYLYATNQPINYDYVQADETGTTLTFDYYCAEYATSELTGYGNLIYLRIWNAAAHFGASDSTSGYTISITRSYYTSNDHFLGAPSYTVWGNDTTSKPGDVNGVIDNNDWFRITTKVGYTIKIEFNSTPATPSPYLDGYLYTDAGGLLASDTSYNISITYTAPYTGDYYFRLYEAAAAYTFGAYSGSSPYYWYIYTTNFDGNDNFADAEEVEPDVTIPSGVSVADMNDYYAFEVPSGYQIHAYGTSSFFNTDLYLYDSTETQVALDDNDAWNINYQHKGLDTEVYYARVHNAGGYSVNAYTLTIDLLKIDPDNDGSMVDATAIMIGTGENATGIDNLGTIDINDYYSFSSVAGDQVIIKIDGSDGLVVRLIQDDGSGTEVTLAEETVASGTATIVYYPNAFYMGETYYFRICAPDGIPIGAYDWNLTKVEFDVEDGYWYYANVLEIEPTIVESSELTPTDTNDWYIMKIPSGCFIEVTISTIDLADPHMDVQYWGMSGFPVIYSNGSSFTFNDTNLFYYELDLYFQIINAGYNAGEYTIEITVTYLDEDNNGGKTIANDMPLDTNVEGELGYNDLNDFYVVEVRSGYNFTMHFNSSHTFGTFIGVQMINENGLVLNLIINDHGSMTYTNSKFEADILYLQFYNPSRMLGFDPLDSVMDYTFNATLINDDPDGDFDRATLLEFGEDPIVITDDLFANVSKPEYPDINDFFVLEMNKGGNLTLEITITGVAHPWFGFYVYNADYEVVASATNDTSLLLTFEANTTGTYYIRVYNTALDEGAYTMVANYVPGASLLEFLTQVWLGLPVWAWLAIGVGGLAIIITTSVLIARAVRKKKTTTR